MTTNAATAIPPRTSVWLRRRRRLWSSWESRGASVVLAIVVGLCLVPPSAWSTSSTEIDLTARLRPPTIDREAGGNVMGTDAVGRDVLVRTLGGTRLTVLIAGLATVLATTTGTAAGLIAGYRRGWADEVISRAIDLLLAFPVLLLIIALVGVFGGNVTSLIVVLGVSGWAGTARVIRSTTLTLTGAEFVEAARAVGADAPRILGRHLLPNVASPVLVLATLLFPQFLLAESAISFLGLGPAAPDVTWGGLIADGRSFLHEAWWVTVFPGAAIFALAFSLSLLGDAMRDAMDPLARSHVKGGDVS